MLGNSLPEGNGRAADSGWHTGRRAATGTRAAQSRAGNGAGVPEKSRSVLREGASVSEKYEFIDAEYASPPVNAPAPAIVQMCRWLDVSKSGFYEWRSRPESATARRRELLKIKIEALFYANDEEYGY